MRDNVKKLVDRLVMVWGVIMIVGLTLLPNFRNELARYVGAIFQPVTALPIHWAILILALVTAFITTIIQKYTMDREGMSETQKRMKEVQSKLKEARVEDDEEKIQKLQAEQKEMMGEFLTVQKKMIKPMFYIMAITIPLFAWIYLITTDPQQTAMFAHGQGVPEGVLIPFLGEIKFSDQFIVIPGGIVWYILCSIPLSQLIRKILNVRMGA